MAGLGPRLLPWSQGIPCFAGAPVPDFPVIYYANQQAFSWLSIDNTTGSVDIQIYLNAATAGSGTLFATVKAGSRQSYNFNPTVQGVLHFVGTPTLSTSIAVAWGAGQTTEVSQISKLSLLPIPAGATPFTQLTSQLTLTSATVANTIALALVECPITQLGQTVYITGVRAHGFDQQAFGYALQLMSLTNGGINIFTTRLTSQDGSNMDFYPNTPYALGPKSSQPGPWPTASILLWPSQYEAFANITGSLNVDVEIAGYVL